MLFFSEIFIVIEKWIERLVPNQPNYCVSPIQMWEFNWHVEVCGTTAGLCRRKMSLQFISYCSEIWQVSWQQCCPDTCQLQSFMQDCCISSAVAMEMPAYGGVTSSSFRVNHWYCLKLGWHWIINSLENGLVPCRGQPLPKLLMGFNLQYDYCINRPQRV